MPPRRDARSPPRVQPQNDQAEEIRLIRRFDTLEQRLDTLEQRLDTLGQKHGDLQRMVQSITSWVVLLALSCLLTFLGYNEQFWVFALLSYLFLAYLLGDRSGIRTLNLAIELVSPAPPPRPPAAS
jgi:hypothetical protein